MSNSKSHNTVRWLMESAIMIAIGTMLSEFPKIDFPLGGGLTICSMLPLVLISWRYGVGRGLIAAAAYSLLQLVLGLNNVQYATSALMAAGIVLLDYVNPIPSSAWPECSGAKRRAPAWAWCWAW